MCQGQFAQLAPPMPPPSKLPGPLLRVPTLQLVKAYGQPPTGKSAQGRRKRGHEASNGTTSNTNGSADYAPVDMSWGGFIMPQPVSSSTSWLTHFRFVTRWRNWPTAPSAVKLVVSPKRTWPTSMM